MESHDERNDSGAGEEAEAITPFRFPVAPGHHDRMLAAAYEMALAVLASPATAPVIDTDACADWLAADVARDRRAIVRTERRGAYPDRRRRQARRLG